MKCSRRCLSFSISATSIYRTAEPIRNSALRSASMSSQSYGYTHTLSCSRTKPKDSMKMRNRLRVFLRFSGMSKMTTRQYVSHFCFRRGLMNSRKPLLMRNSLPLPVARAYQRPSSSAEATSAAFFNLARARLFW